MKENIIIQFERIKSGETFDLEIPLHITANELVNALNSGLGLGMQLEDITQNYLIAENPVVLLRGDILLEQLGLRDGSKILFKN